MQTRLVILQELIARRKALRSEEIEVCPAKGSGQQARALRGSRRERQQIELTGERPRWYQTPRRVHSSVARRCREDSGAKGSPLRARQRPRTPAPRETTHAGTLQSAVTNAGRSGRDHATAPWVQRSAPFSQRLLSAGCAPLAASAPGAARALLHEELCGPGVARLPDPARPLEDRLVGPRVADELGLDDPGVRLRRKGCRECSRQPVQTP